MAHVHGEMLAGATKKMAKEAAGAGMKGAAMTEGMGKMMEGGMTGMMGGPGMRNMMEHGMGSMMMGSGGGTGMMMAPRAAAAAGAATGVAVTATRHSLLRRIVTHPLVLFGAGLAIGYLIHKYREEITAAASETTD